MVCSSLVGGGDGSRSARLPGRRRSPSFRPFFSCALGSARCPTRRYAGRTVRPHAGLGGAARPLWESLPARVPRTRRYKPEAFAVVGMAAFFTGVVRAPLTGIVLVIEMTASFTMLLPMLGACFMAMLVPTLLRDAPIYDSLGEHTVRGAKGAPQPP